MSLINLTGVEIGSERDNDQVLRQMRFFQNDDLAIFSCFDGVSYSCFSLGEQEVLGLPGTDREDEYIVDDPDYVLANLQALNNEGCFASNCWISLDCTTKGIVDSRLSDEVVLSSIEQFKKIMNSLEEHLKQGGSHRGFWNGQE